MTKTALVTGVGQGLGNALVYECLERGYRVFALDLKQENPFRKETDVVYLSCDISDGNSVESARKAVFSQASSLDFFANVAGIWLDQKRLPLEHEDFDFESAEIQFKVNALGTLRMMKAFLPLTEKSNSGTMVNVTSEAGSLNNCFRTCEYGYCMSKAAENMATKIAQNAYPRVRIYAFHPGWMKTPQGFAGSTKECSPQQDPKDTAKFLLDLIENKTFDFPYLDCFGNRLLW